MFSVMFALVAILGIALMNLFLGFASAILLGRGPKSWSDLDNAVTVRYFSPRLAFPRARRTAELVDVPSVPRPAPSSAAPPPDEPPDMESHAPAPVSFLDEPAPVAAPAVRPAWDATTHRLVLPPKPTAAPEEEGPPEAVFARQLETWRTSQQREETPCLSGIMVSVQHVVLDDCTRDTLMKAVHASIAGQLRKDRRVLRIADNQFLWFSADMQPDEGLAPVERTRQILHNTRFLHDGNALAVSVQAAIVVVSAEDSPAELIQRLQRTLQYALEKGEGSTCIDVGYGPGFVQPPKLDLDEIECVLQ
jgi:hypothetical protein